MKQLFPLVLFFISFSVFSSIHIVDEHEFSFEEREKLGFLKVTSPENSTKSDPKIMLFTFPATFEKDFQIRDVYLEGFEGEQVIFKASLKFEDAENGMLKDSFVSIIASSNTTYKMSILYSKTNPKNSIEVSRLIKLGDIELMVSTPYMEYIKWGRFNKELPTVSVTP